MRNSEFKASFLDPKAKILVAALIVAGCAVGPDFQTPEAPSVNRYTYEEQPDRTAEAEGMHQYFTSENDMISDWWTLFNAPLLNDILQQSMTHNPGLKAAEASLRASEDNLRSGYGVFYPQLNGNFAASRQRDVPLKSGEDFPPTIFNLFTLSATVSYTLDVFGGERRLVEELGAEADAQKAQEQATWLTLSANIVNTAIAKAAYTDEIDVTHKLINAETEQRQIAEDQEKAGTIPYVNVLTIETQLASTEATLPPLLQKLNQSDDLLAQLAGSSPAEWKSPYIKMGDLSLPIYLPLSLPSRLVHQRPDILEAEAAMHAASANIGIATAAMLPNFMLNGNYGSNGNSSGTLFSASGSSWGLAASTATPIFDGGTLWFQREAAKEQYQQTAMLYRQTVLTAFTQVADTLHALGHDAEALKASDTALQSAWLSLKLTETNFKAGLVSYSDVLAAEIQYYQAALNHFQVLALRYQDTVALFTALGGGWWGKEGNAREETAP